MVQRHYHKKYDKPTEWSEEDKLIISKIKSVLNAQEYHDGATGKKMNPYNDALDWLNSLRPQKQWKPSEKQMNALELMILYKSPLNILEHLHSLYDDLKKLIK